MQDNVLLKFKPLLIFLRENSQETYVEISNYYSEVMDKVYYNLIKTYIKDSAKIISERVGKNDLIIKEGQDKNKILGGEYMMSEGNSIVKENPVNMSMVSSARNNT